MSASRARPLSLEARRLSVLVEQLAGDRVLSSLVSLATGDLVNFDPEITVLTGGQLFRGRLKPPEAFAEALDSHLVQMAAAATVNLPAQGSGREQEIREVLMETFKDAFAEQFQIRRDRKRRAQERLEEVWGPPTEWDKDNPPLVDDLPDDLARLAILEQAPVTVLTLDHAELLSGRGWEPIGLIRIVVAQVAAWWMPGMADGGENSTSAVELDPTISA